MEDSTGGALEATLDDVVGTLVEDATATRLIRVPAVMAALARRLHAAVRLGDVHPALAAQRVRGEDGFVLRTLQLLEGALVFAQQVARRPLATGVWLQTVAQPHAAPVTKAARLAVGRLAVKLAVLTCGGT